MAPTRLPPAPPIEPGESREAYLRRLAEFYPKAPPSRRGRTGVRVNAARIERDVRIFYRLVLMRPEPDTIYAVTQAEGMASPSNTKRARDRGRTVLEKGVPPFRVVSRG
jgi:hypothetical protein